MDDSAFKIATLKLASGGRLGICPLPGRHGRLTDDLAAIVSWAPALVLSMTELSEMRACGGENFGHELTRRGIRWEHLPVRDFGGLSGDQAKRWPDLASRLHGHLDQGDGVMVHCHGGRGRSGMIILRLLVERGEAADAALSRLRMARPGAVETVEQKAWASLSSD